MIPSSSYSSSCLTWCPGASFSFDCTTFSSCSSSCLDGSFSGSFALPGASDSHHSATFRERFEKRMDKRKCLYAQPRISDSETKRPCNFSKLSSASLFCRVNQRNCIFWTAIKDHQPHQSTKTFRHVQQYFTRCFVLLLGHTKVSTFAFVCQRLSYASFLVPARTSQTFLADVCFLSFCGTTGFI